MPYISKSNNKLEAFENHEPFYFLFDIVLDVLAERCILLLQHHFGVDHRINRLSYVREELFKSLSIGPNVL